MNALATALLGIAAAGALLLALPNAAVSQSQTTTASSTSPSTFVPIAFGMDAGSVATQAAAGAKPDYGTFWIGPWTLTSGWGGPDAQLDAMRSAGVTPAIHFYYWGDDISPTCVENGCWSSLHNAQKDQAHWQMLADQLVAHLNSKMQGKPVLVFLETEFNKGSVATYEPLDGYLAAKADQIHAGYPAAKVVMALGNWGQSAWPTWDRTAAASDYVGVQGMRGSTRQSATDYQTLYEMTVAGAKTAKADFGKPVVVQDAALSSYPEPDWLSLQRDELKQFFDSRAELHSAGVEALIYRSWKDSPTMDTANWYGEAERHWGLAWPDGTMKPAGQVWVDGVKAERAGAPSPSPTPPPPPPAIALPAGGGSAEAEAFATRTAGGLQSESAAAGGKAWNLWSNGYVQQSFDVAPGTYDVALRARGTPLAGVAPHMAATIGGSPVAADPGTSYSDYTTRLTLGGTVDVKVQFTNDGQSSTEDRNLVVDQVRFTLVPPNRAPVAAFSAAATGLSVDLDASATSDPDGDAVSYAWDFGDGGSAASTGPTASHAYAAGGTYTVTLTASDGKLAGTASRSVSVVQPNRAPTAAFTASMGLLTATVDGGASSDPDGDALTYAWSFGDGTTAVGKTASHAYLGAGAYTIGLTVGDGKLSSSATQDVQALQPNRAPTAAFTATASQLTVAVDASGSTDPDGDPLGYSWAFGDGATATGKAASHAYAKAGTYTVTLTASDGKLSASASRTVTVTAPTSSSATSSSPTPYAATFTVKPSSGEWWQQVHVTASPAPSRVQMSVNGGAWQTMTLQGYGDWTASAHVAKGSKVVFRATAPDGRMASSPTLTWLGASSSTTTTPAFTASFTPKSVGNDWWVEAAVTGNQPIAKVEAKVGSGAWTALSLQDWGSWAKSLNAPNGSPVTFRATSSTGATATSSPVTWT
jgi:PKD repeat protein